MQSIKEATGTYMDALRLKVIARELLELDTILETEETLNELGQFVYDISSHDTCGIDSTNPVLYSELFVAFMFEQYELWYATELEKEDDQDEYLDFEELTRDLLAFDYFTYLDEFTQYARQKTAKGGE